MFVMIRFPKTPHHQFAIILAVIAHALIALEVPTFNVLRVVLTIKDILLVVLAHVLMVFITQVMPCVNNVISHAPNVPLLIPVLNVWLQIIVFYQIQTLVYVVIPFNIISILCLYNFYFIF